MNTYCPNCKIHYPGYHFYCPDCGAPIAGFVSDKDKKGQDYDEIRRNVENEWRELLIRFISAGDQIFQDRKNSDPTGFAWWMVRNYIIRQDPEIQIIIDKRTTKT